MVAGDASLPALEGVDTARDGARLAGIAVQDRGALGGMHRSGSQEDLARSSRSKLPPAPRSRASTEGASFGLDAAIALSPTSGRAAGAAHALLFSGTLAEGVNAGPITDVVVLFGSDAAPEGFTKVRSSLRSRIKADLNKGSGGKYVYLALRRGSGEPITAISVINVNRGEFTPPGYTVVKSVSGANADLNSGSGGDEAYLCVRRGVGAPITDIGVIFPENEDVPAGYTRLSRTPLGRTADLNAGAGGKRVFLCFRRDLTHLRVLSGDMSAAHGSTVSMPLQRPGAPITTTTVKHGFSASMNDLNSGSAIPGVHPKRVRAHSEAVHSGATSIDAAASGEGRQRGESGGARSTDFSLSSITPTSIADADTSRHEAATSDTERLSPVPYSGGGASVGRSRRDSILTGFEIGDFGGDQEISDRRVRTESSLQAVGEEDGDGSHGLKGSSLGTSTLTHNSLSMFSIRSVRTDGEWAAEFADAWWNAGMSVLEPSAMGRLVWPLLAACYDEDPVVVCTALEGLTELVNCGFMLPLDHIAFGDDETAEAVRGDASEELDTCSVESLWRLLDFIVVTICDATDMLFDATTEARLALILAIAELHGPGQHPVTLHRLVEACLSATVFFNQKKIHAARGLAWATKHARTRDAEDFQLVNAGAKRQAVCARDALKRLVQAVTGAVETATTAVVATARAGYVSHSWWSAPVGTVAPPGAASESVAAVDGLIEELLGRVRLGSTMKACLARYHCHHTLSPGFAVEMHMWSRLLLGLEVDDSDDSSAHGDSSRRSGAASGPDGVVFTAAGAGAHGRSWSTKTPSPERRHTSDSGSVSDGGEASSRSGSESEGALELPFTCRSRESDACVLLLILCKMASTPLQVKSNGLPRRSSDFHVKLLSLQLLRELVQHAGERFQGIPALAFCVRRFAVTALIANFRTHSVVMTVIFRESVGLLPVLWQQFRAHLKLEFAGILDGIVLRVLKSPYRTPEQAIDLLTAFKNWFETPQNLVELYHNYDNDAPFQHLRLFAKLCATLCSLAEGSDLAGTHETPSVEMHHAQRELESLALSCIGSVVRSLMDAAGTVHLIPRDEKTRRLSKATWHSAYKDGQQSPASRSVSAPDVPPSAFELAASAAAGDSLFNSPTAASGGAGGHTGGIDDDESRVGPHGRRKTLSKHASVHVRRQTQLRNAEVLEKGLELARTKSLKKAIHYLVAMSYIQNTPDAISSFLRIYADQLDEVAIGDYLSEEGRTETEKQQFEAIREAYFGNISFAGLTFAQALRVMLTKSGFRLPGEAQKIDRIANAFARAFHVANPDVFSEPDTVFVLTFSTIMLNTDAHNPSIRKDRKMTVDQFVSNNRGIDGGKDIPRPVLEALYHEIVNDEIKMGFGAPGSAPHPDGSPASRDAKSLSRSERTEAFLEEMNASVERTVALLNSQSLFWRNYHQHMIADIVRLMLEDIWTDVLSLVTSLSSARDASRVQAALMMLRDIISASLFLEVSEERRTFAGVLARLVYTLDVDPSLIVSAEAGSGVATDARPLMRRRSTAQVAGSAGRRAAAERQVREKTMESNFQSGFHQRAAWYSAVIGATRATTVDAIRELHLVVAEAIEKLDRAEAQEEIIDTARRFTKTLGVRKDLEADTSRRLIYESDLTKVSRNGKGRRKVYRFFLFSDFLVYASETTFGSKWNAHARVQLADMEIDDSPADLDLGSHSFVLKNPVKDLYLVAETAADAAAWRRSIAAAKRDLVKRHERDEEEAIAATDTSGLLDRPTSRNQLDVHLENEAEAEADSDYSSEPDSGNDPSDRSLAESVASVTNVSSSLDDALATPSATVSPADQAAASRAMARSRSQSSLTGAARVYGHETEDDNVLGLSPRDDSPITRQSVHTVAFSTAPFGFLLRASAKTPAARVSRVRPASDAEAGQVQPGDALLVVGSTDVSTYSFEDILAAVQAASKSVSSGRTKTVTMTFRTLTQRLSSSFAVGSTGEAGAAAGPQRGRSRRMLQLGSSTGVSGGVGTSPVRDIITAVEDADDDSISDVAEASDLAVSTTGFGSAGSGLSDAEAVHTPTLSLAPDFTRRPLAADDTAMSTTPVMLSSPASSMRRLSSRSLSIRRRSGSNSVAAIKSTFLEAVEYARPILSRPSAGQAEPASTQSRAIRMPDRLKLRLYGLFKQATRGDSHGPKGRETTEDAMHMALAWRECAGMRRRDAMRLFVDTLNEAVPGWAFSAHAAPPPAPTPKARIDV